MWIPSGLQIFERRAAEAEFTAGQVRARVRSTPRRVTVLISAPNLALAAAAGHQIVAAVYDEIARSEGWLVAEPSIAVGDGAVRVTICGVGALAAASAALGVSLAIGVRPGAQLGLGVL